MARRCVLRRARAVGLVRAGALSVACAASAPACHVDGIDLAGKACPCAGGYVCDTTSNTCVVSLPDAGADASAFDAAVDAPRPAPRIVISGFRATWTTANAIRWDWSAQGDPSDFDRYEIVTGPTEAAVRARAPGVRVWGRDDNPELGELAGRDKIISGQTIPLWTVTDEHGEGTTVFAQLSALDRAGIASASEVLSAKTSKPSGRHVVFGEADVPGESTPAGFARGQDRPFKGKFCYSADGLRCAAGDATCFLSVQRMKVNDPVTDMPDAAFDGAFLEIAVAGQARVAGYYSNVGLSFGGDPCATNAPNTCRWRFGGWTFRGDDQYRIVQVPLAALRRASNGDPFTLAELRAKQANLYGFYLEGTWADKAAVRVDEISIRW